MTFEESQVVFVVGVFFGFLSFAFGIAMSDIENILNRFRSKKKKGHLFESYIIDLFNYADGYFSLKEWRSDKKHKGVYPISSTYPDLHYRFNYNGFIHEFAVECKFRNIKVIEKKKGRDRQITLLRRQLDNYYKYQQEHNIPVYLAIGLGDTPKRVYELYLIPLNDILKRIGKGNSIPYSFMMRYYRHPEKRFYLDRNTILLK